MSFKPDQLAIDGTVIFLCSLRFAPAAVLESLHQQPYASDGTLELMTNGGDKLILPLRQLLLATYYIDGHCQSGYQHYYKQADEAVPDHLLPPGPAFCAVVL